MFDLAALARLDDGLARLHGATVPRLDDTPGDADHPAVPPVRDPRRDPVRDAAPRCPFAHGAAA